MLRGRAPFVAQDSTVTRPCLRAEPRRLKCSAIRSRKEEKREQWWTNIASSIAAGMVTTTALFSGPAMAADKIGEFTASGIIFKDSVQVLAIDDPEVKGVTIYISAGFVPFKSEASVIAADYSRNFADKIQNLGNEPSSASVTCALTGPVVIKDPSKLKGKGGEDVFSEKRGLGFIQNKTLHVRRIFDEPHKSLLYIAYSTRLTNDKSESPGKYKTSICALPISSEVAPVANSDVNKDSGLFAPAQNNST